MATKTFAESVEELDDAVADLRREFIHVLAGSRLGHFLGWFYEWERVRIGERLAKVATIVLAVNLLYIWPVAIIELALRAMGIGK